MGRISVGEAISAGFKVIGREPASFAVWCVIYLAINFLPMLTMLPETLALYRGLGAGGQADDAQMLDAANRISALQPLSYLALLAVTAVLPAAVFRAVLSPNDRRFFYLRLGMREFWVLIVTIVVVLIWIAAIIGALIPTGILLFSGGLLAGGAGAGGTAVMVLLSIVAYVAAIGVSVWIVLRFSMAPVLSFADNTFRVPESWRLTKGHTWRLFLVGLALFVISVLGQLILVAAGVAAVAAGTPNFLQTLESNPAALLGGIAGPALIAGTVVLSVFGVAVYVMGAAAWAEIYRQLKPPLEETFS